MISRGIDALRAATTPGATTPGAEATNAARAVERADHDFRRALLYELLRPMTEALFRPSEGEDGGLMQTSGLDAYGGFWTEAMADRLASSWPSSGLSAPSASPTGADATATVPPKPRLDASPTPSLPDELLARAGRLFDLPVNLLRAVVQVESGGRPDAVSPAGAVGLMQLMPATARELGVENSKDPWQNIAGGAKYLARQLQRFGQLEEALAAYNAGPGAVARHGGIPPYAETRNYVERVLDLKARFDRSDPSGA